MKRPLPDGIESSNPDSVSWHPSEDRLGAEAERWMNEVEHLQEQSSTWPRRGMLDEELWVMPGLLLSCWVSLWDRR